MDRIQMSIVVVMSWEKIQRNNKQIKTESVKDDIQNISHMIGFLKNNNSSVALSLFKRR